MTVPPGQVLKEARAAVKAGDYALALERYERFFDRALLDQGNENNYYGVRLSYCLDEWSRLGKKYPVGLARLETKATEALAAFEKSADYEKFHDYKSIQNYLGRMEMVLSQFEQYHNSKPELALAVLDFMWNYLIEAKRWEICSAYLDDYESRYKRALHKFDQSMKICMEDPALGSEEFADQIKDWYVRDVGNLLCVLRNTGQEEAFAKLNAAVSADMQARQCPELVERVGEQAVL